VKRRLLAEIAAAILVAALLVTLAWWWNRPAHPNIEEFQCPAPVEIVSRNGSALWCGDDELPALLERLELANCEAAIRTATASGPPLRLVLSLGCEIELKLTSLSPTVLTALGLPLDLNTATAKDLTFLDGIGPKLAKAIIDDREANGAFCSVEEMARVKGIGPVRIDGLKASGVVASCAP